MILKNEINNGSNKSKSKDYLSHQKTKCHHISLQAIQDHG